MSLYLCNNTIIVQVRYIIIETKEFARIGYNGFLFPHEYSDAPRPSPEYSCGKRNPLYPIRAASFVSIVLYPMLISYWLPSLLSCMFSRSPSIEVNSLCWLWTMFTKSSGLLSFHLTDFVFWFCKQVFKEMCIEFWISDRIGLKSFISNSCIKWNKLEDDIK